MTEYVCPHWGDPFSVVVFQNAEDAHAYANDYKTLTGYEMKIEVEEK